MKQDQMRIYSRRFDWKGRDVGDLLDAFRDEPGLTVLESRRTDKDLGRFSFVGVDPFRTFRASGPGTLDKLAREFRSYPVGRCPATPFPAGAVGYLSYDLGWDLEPARRRKRAAPVVPHAVFSFYDTVITVDHGRQQLILTATGLPEKTERLRAWRARRRLDWLAERIAPVLHAGSGCGRPSGFSGKKAPPRLKSDFGRAAYQQAVRRALDYIRAGDIYQVNLAQRFSLQLDRRVDRPLALQLYQSLNEHSSTSFAAFMDCGDFQLISGSPERFLCLHEGSVQTRPMKGTRPRGKTRAEDLRLKRSLLNSLKERAELLMITDLERNDLGRVCGSGSVRVRDLRTIEAYPTVYQATSTVDGRLEEGRDAFDLLRAAFPGGSITGCPKIRAMEIIDELEPSVRGIYTGGLGYLSFSGGMDMNILIRTLLARGRELSFHVGSGIVADSSPAAEYEETLVKARALQACLNGVLAGSPEPDDPRSVVFLDGKFRHMDEKEIAQWVPGVFQARGVFETMRAYDGRVFLLDEHLTRLRRGLRALGLVCPYPRRRLADLVKATLRANRLTNARLRLMVWAQRQRIRVMISAVPCEPPAPGQYQKGFCLALSRVGRDAVFQGIKSLQYKAFRDAYLSAVNQGADEMLLLNRREEVVEGSRSNLFIVKNGRLLTPPLAGGCLPGITRRAVIRLARASGIPVSTRRLTRADLFSADEAFVTNSMIEMMPVRQVDTVLFPRSRPVTELLRTKYKEAREEKV